MRQLPPGRLAELRAAPLTFDRPRATLGPPVAGYDVLRRSRVIGSGESVLTAAGDALMSWQVHEGAGLRVSASGPVAEEGAVVDVLLGIGRLGLRAPCRVVHAVREPHRIGFAYATLPGHPETGEERFEVVMAEDGTVRGTVLAYAVASWWVARLGGPVTRLAQRVAADRYVAAMERAGRGQPARRRAR